MNTRKPPAGGRFHMEESMPSNTSAETSMEQVRELLMGTQLKDMENRILRQEERLLKEIAVLRDALKTRVESLENFMLSESSSLLHRLQEEKAERAESLKAENKDRADAMQQDRREREEAVAQLARDLAAREEALDRKIAAVSSTLDTAEHELRQLLLSESARLSAAAEEKYQNALAALARTAGELRNDLVSRSSLSGLFTESAVKLAGDLRLSPDTEDTAGNAEEAD
jgi:signal transduction histidine kinase